MRIDSWPPKPSFPPDQYDEGTKVWKDWQRCCRRGYRKPTESDWEEYRLAFGTKPQQNQRMQIVTRTEIVTRSRVAYRASQMGRKAFNELKARIDAGKAPKSFQVSGDEILVVVRVSAPIKERVGKKVKA